MNPAAAHRLPRWPAIPASRCRRVRCQVCRSASPFSAAPTANRPSSSSPLLLNRQSAPASLPVSCSRPTCAHKHRFLIARSSTFHIITVGAHVMSATPKKECRLVAVILLWAGLDGAPCWPDNAAESEGNLPPPAQVFTPRTALAVYVNLQDANKSAIWRAIADKAGPLAEHFQTLQQGKLSSMQAVHGIPGFNPTNVAEIAIALEGDKILSDLQTEHFDPASGFVAVVRLAPAQDVDTLIQQTLEAIDKEKPGLRGPIEKSRRRARSAEVFDIPAELLGELKLPFSVSCAIGPGQEGTLLCLGRSENLQAFLSGKTIGKLRGAINETLSRRGQIWFHTTMPKEASKNLGGSGPDANPMLAGLAQSLDKVRDASLSLNFAAGQIDFEIDL